jgi:hypothetical protein
MKRKAILKKLADAGLTLVEGGNHTKVYDKSGKYLAPVGRHGEIKEYDVFKIEKQTGIKLR